VSFRSGDTSLPYISFVKHRYFAFQDKLTPKKLAPRLLYREVTYRLAPHSWSPAKSHLPAINNLPPPGRGASLPRLLPPFLSRLGNQVFGIFLRDIVVVSARHIFRMQRMLLLHGIRKICLAPSTPSAGARSVAQTVRILISGFLQIILTI